MKLNKFYFAALAAMTIVSCSNEQDIVAPSVPDLKPGEALVTFNLTGRGTTRATAEQEKKIKLLRYNVYVGEGDTIAINRRNVGNDKISFTIPAEKVTELNGQEMRILVLANATDDDLRNPFGKKLSDAPNAGSNYDYDKLAEVMKDLSKELDTAETGLPGSVEATFTMSAGMINIDANSNKLQRAVSRIYLKMVKGGGVGDISGTIKFKNIASASWIFQPMMKNSSIIPEGNEILLKDTPNQVVAYVYPTYASSKPSVLININGKEQTLDITKDLDRNKQYGITINITTSTDSDSELVWTPTFDEWVDGTIGETDVVVPNVTVPLKNNFKAGNTIAVENGKLAVNVYGSSEILPSELFEGDVQLTNVNSVTPVTRANALDTPSDGVVTARLADGKLILTVENAEVGKAHKEYRIDLDAMVDGKQKKIILPIVAKGYPENFSVNINGVEMMTVGVQDNNAATDPSSIINVVNAVNAMPGANFAEKAKAYVAQNQNDNEKIFMGKPFLHSEVADSKCPAGFQVPNVSHIRQAFGVTLPIQALNGTSKIIVPENTAPVTEGFGENNSMEHLSTPHYHYIFRYKDGNETKELYIPRGDKNGIDTPANNFTFANPTGTYKFGRLVFWRNEVQMRTAVNMGSTNWLRCVRKPKNTNP